MIAGEAGINMVRRAVVPVDGDAGMPGGLGIYDIANPAAPKLIHKWAAPGKGVHRFDFDGRYFYGSATQKGYRGTIVMILDLADPANPREVGRWHMEGQHIEGGPVNPGEVGLGEGAIEPAFHPRPGFPMATANPKKARPAVMPLPSTCMTMDRAVRPR